MKYRGFILACAFGLVVISARANPASDGKVLDNSVHGEDDFNRVEEGLLRKMNLKCAQRDVGSCVMLKLVTYMNRALKKASIEIGTDLRIMQTGQISAQDDSTAQRSLAGLTDEVAAAQLVANKMWEFVKTRSLKYKLFDDAEFVVSSSPDSDGTLNFGLSVKAARAIEKGRGKMKNMGPLLAAVVMKVGLLAALAFKGLTLLVGKALILSKIALLLAGIIGIKKLFSQSKHVTYEVVAHPHHTHSHAHDSHGGHDSYSSGWGRSLIDQFQNSMIKTAAQEIAYKAQKPSS